jgi:hypothetical protein
MIWATFLVFVVFFLITRFYFTLHDWNEKKKLQRRITAAKKVLDEMEQGHILEG